MAKEKFRNFWENEDLFIKQVKDITNSVVNIRNEKDLTQSNLAELTGLKQQQISKFENGMSNWSLKTLFKVLKALGLELRLEKSNGNGSNPASNDTGFYSAD